MNDRSSSQAPEGAAPLVIQFPCGSEEELFRTLGASISRGGVFVRSQKPRALGSRVEVSLVLKGGQVALRGPGVVAFITGPDSQRVRGMGIAFGTLDPAATSLLERFARPGTGAPWPPGAGEKTEVLQDAHAPTGSAAIAPAAADRAAAVVGGTSAARPGTARAGAPASGGAGAGPTPAARPGAGPGSPGAVRPDGGAASPGPRRPAPPSAAEPPALVPVVGPAVASDPGIIENPLDAVQAPSSPPRGPIIGIDLGTTYSCVAFCRNGKPFVIPSREGHNTIPSVVAVARGRLMVGHPALSQMLINPLQTVYGSKRLIGRPFHSPFVARVRARFPFEIVEGEGGEAAVKLGGEVWSLQRIAALILREAQQIACDQLGEKVERAVVTVPAYYNDNQRQAVREAGRLAGLHVERILNEPTAAALAFGYQRKLQKTVLIYDLGGGTFDASLLKLSDNVYEVVSSGGDTFLGGVDFDVAVTDWLIRTYEQLTGANFEPEPVSLQRLLQASENAKRLLSEQNQTRINVPFLTFVRGEPYHLDVALNRGTLNELTGSLVERTLTVCDEVLAAAKMKREDLDEVLLVGGMSRMPLVREKVEAHFGKAPHKGVHPDEAVALGAALFGGSLGTDEGVVLIDVLPMSVGFGSGDGKLERILERNTALPTSRSQVFPTTRDGQREMELTLYQGDGATCADAECLGTVRIGPLPAAPKGLVKVEVTLSLSAECLLQVTARELTRGLDVKAQLTAGATPESLRARIARATAAGGAGRTPAAGRGGEPSAPADPGSAPPPDPAAGKGLFGKLRSILPGRRP